jgi:hypothetical protein
LPTEFGAFTRIEYLELDSNNFEGSIPESWESLTHLSLGNHAPREGAPTGSCGVFLGYNKHPSGKFGYTCPYPSFLLAPTKTNAPRSTVASGWGINSDCGLSEKDETPDEEKPHGDPELLKKIGGLGRILATGKHPKTGDQLNEAHMSKITALYQRLRKKYDNEEL